TYYVAVTSGGYEGEYRFRVTLAAAALTAEVEANEAPGTATALTLTTSGSNRTGTGAGYVQTTADLDYFNLGTVNAGQTIFLSTRKTTTSNLDPVVAIYNASNGYVVESGNGRPFDGVAQVNVTTTGVYYAVMRSGTGTGGLLDQYLMDVNI